MIDRDERGGVAREPVTLEYARTVTGNRSLSDILIWIAALVLLASGVLVRTYHKLSIDWFLFYLFLSIPVALSILGLIAIRKRRRRAW